MESQLTGPVEPVLLELETIVSLENFKNRNDVAGGRNGWPTTWGFQRWPGYRRNFVEQIQSVTCRVTQVTRIELSQSSALYLLIKIRRVGAVFVDQVISDEWKVGWKKKLFH